MAVSPYSVVMALLWFTAAALIGCLMLRKAGKYGIVFVSVIFILAILRAVLPLDLADSIVIRSEKIYPMIEDLLAVRVLGNVTLGGSLLIVWGVGTLIQLLCFFRKGVRQANFLRQTAHEGTNRVDGKLAELFAGICDASGYRGKWTLTVSSEISTVYQAGFFRPHILLPESIEDFSEQDICNVFRHELQHFLGKDLWIKTGTQMAVCLLWWNPAVRLLNRSVQQLLELLCDRRACKNLSQEEQISYLESLLRFLKGATTMSVNSMTLSYLGNPAGSNVKQRVQLVLQDEASAWFKCCLWTGCILCVLLFVMSYMVILQPAGLPPAMEDGYELVILTPQNSYILHTTNGKYVIYYNDDFYTILVSEESIFVPPYCDLPIIQEGEEKT